MLFLKKTTKKQSINNYWSDFCCLIKYVTKKKWLNRIRYGCSAYIFTIVRVNHYVNVTGLLASTSQIDLKAAGTFGPIQSNRLLLWLLQLSWDHNIFHRLKMWPWASSGLGSTCVMRGHPNVTTHLTFAPCKVESRPNTGPTFLLIWAVTRRWSLDTSIVITDTKYETTVINAIQC